MELKAFEVQVCARAEARGLEMAFLVKATLGKSPIGRRFCYFPIVSEGEPSGIQTGSRLPNCQAYGCFEETDSVSRQLCFEPLFLDLPNVKEI